LVKALHVCPCVIIVFTFFDLVKVSLKTIDLCVKSIFLKLHEHLFFDGGLIFSREMIKSFLVLLKLGIELVSVTVKFLLFLLNSSMINLLEVSLLSQLVIG